MASVSSPQVASNPAAPASSRLEIARGDMPPGRQGRAAAEGRLGSSLKRQQRMREAALLTFRNPVPNQAKTLLQLSAREWSKLLRWLDISGLALYLADRLNDLGWSAELPAAATEGLRRRLSENTARTRSMIKESVAIQEQFQSAGISYSVLKGVSFCPSSAVRPELRHQFDLDYLVAERDSVAARRILERRGYRLYAASGRSWEFKVNERPTISRDALYRPSNGHAVELHLEAEHGGSAARLVRGSRLDRVLHRELYGISMPVLAPADLFLGQGMHAFKDICGAFLRTAHLLEFYRHVLAHGDDAMFWSDLRDAVAQDRRTSVGIGVVVYLLTSVLGPFAPAQLSNWTADVLPAGVRLWIDRYGYRIVFGTHPGTKLYLLLEQELEAAGLPSKRPSRDALLPSKLPPRVMRALPNESLSTRCARWRLQSSVVFGRLRFHLLEGARYALEAYKWRIYRQQHPS